MLIIQKVNFIKEKIVNIRMLILEKGEKYDRNGEF